MTSEIWQWRASEIAKKVRARQISAMEVAEQVLARLSAVNPKINAVVQEFPDQVLADARKCDEDVAHGKSLGILQGVPVTIKVTIDQAGYASTNGLRMLKDHKAEVDSPVVANFKKAGAVVVGRTNTPAFSMRWFTRNSLHGQTLNPRNTALTPGGSSGGAAAATAAGIGAIGHGTDIAGSIRYPAYACGLHGLRPTPGRIPAVNLSLPDRHIGSQLASVSGPLARSVEDVRLGYHAMAAASTLDPLWMPVRHDLGAYNKTAVVCTTPEGLETSDAVAEEIAKAARALERSGWKIVEMPIPPLREAASLQLRLWFSEFAIDQGRSIYEENDADAIFIFEQGMALLDRPITLQGLMETLQQRIALVRQWQQYLSEHTLLLCPISAQPPFPDGLDVRSPQDFRDVFEAQLTQVALPFVGVPAMSVCTSSGSLPLGVQLVAARFREDILIEAASVIEMESGRVAVADV